MADYDLKYTGAQIDGLLDAANELKTNGFIYKGVATPSTNPGTPTERVAYLASEPGTYTNFGGIVITSGLYSLTYASGTWTGTQMQAGSDIEVVQTTGQSATAVMSQKAVTDELNDINIKTANDANTDLDIADERGNVLARFSGGDFKVKNFNSETDAPTRGEDGTYGDLEVADENGNILCIFENGNIRTKNFNSANINIKDERFIFVAAVDSSPSDKDKADFICGGTNDETTINAAIARLNGNGKVLLAKGTYYIDSFQQTNDGYVAILLSNNNMGTITIEGNDDSYGHFESQKVKFIVSSAAYDALNNNDFYSIIRHNAININRHFVVNNIGFEIYDNQKKIICIDALYSGSVDAYNCVGKVTQHPATWNANPPSDWVIPNEDCVFFRGLSMSQNSNDTIRYCIAASFGVGFAVQGEHIELNSCASVCCQYGYTFNKYPSKSTGGAYCHPMLVVNCLDEMCANYPKFYNNTFRQSVRIINYHAEYKPAWFALGGKYAEESTAGQWYGFINYANQMFGTPYNLQNSPSLKFWEAGNGKNVISINDAQSFFATTSERNGYAPNYGQQIYDTTLNKLCICKDTNPVTWVDANGQIV